jgi:transposase-like protein
MCAGDVALCAYINRGYMFEVQKQRRDLGDDFKRKIVAEILNTGVTAASIARRHNIKVSRIYKWKKIYGSEIGFMPISVVNSAPSSTNDIVNKPNNSVITITLANGSNIAFEGDYGLSDIVHLAQGLSS